MSACAQTNGYANECFVSSQGECDRSEGGSRTYLYLKEILWRSVDLLEALLPRLR